MISAPKRSCLEPPGSRLGDVVSVCLASPDLATLCDSESLLKQNPEPSHFEELKKTEKQEDTTSSATETVLCAESNTDVQYDDDLSDFANSQEYPVPGGRGNDPSTESTNNANNSWANTSFADHDEVRAACTLEDGHATRSMIEEAPDVVMEDDSDLYNNLASLLYGMNTCRINCSEALILTKKNIEVEYAARDAVVAGMCALLLDPRMDGLPTTEPKNITEAREKWEDSKAWGLVSRARQGSPWAQWLLGLMSQLNAQSMPPNESRSESECSLEARSHVNTAAHHGHTLAKDVLGTYYQSGFVVRTNNATAHKWVTEAAKEGHAQAQYHMGLWLLKSETTSSNTAQAILWLEAAEKQGFGLAQGTLGRMYRYGLHGVSQNVSFAVELYQQAAHQGDLRATNNLGRLYQKGVGVPRSIARAVIFFRLAANNGCPVSQTNIGLLYEKGLGVPMDTTKAIEWYERAARQGYKPAQKCRTRLSTHRSMSDTSSQSCGSDHSGVLPKPREVAEF